MFRPIAVGATLAWALALLPGAAPAANSHKGQSAHPFKGRNCQVKRPPADARRVELHGFTMASYPKPRPAAYTGCQTAWIGEEGAEGFRILFVSYFDAGKVVALWMDEEPDERPPQVCRYDKDGRTLGETQDKACPEAGDLAEP